jgi:hypothetical protein
MVQLRPAILACALVCAGGAATAAAADAPKASGVMKHLRGVVAGVTGSGIAVEYETHGSAGYEMYLPFDAEIQMLGFEQAADLRLDDRVVVEYREADVTNESGEVVGVRRTATRLALLERAPDPTPETVVTGEAE